MTSLKPTRAAKIAIALDTSHAALRKVLRQLKDEAWDNVVQGDDAHWTVKDTLVHLVDAQRGMLGQMQRIQAGQESVPPDFDLNRWNQSRVNKAKASQPAELLDTLDADHIRLTEFVNGLTDADLDKTGRHSTLKIMSIEEIAYLIAQHEQSHLMHIQAVLS